MQLHWLLTRRRYASTLCYTFYFFSTSLCSSSATQHTRNYYYYYYNTRQRRRRRRRRRSSSHDSDESPAERTARPSLLPVARRRWLYTLPRRRPAATVIIIIIIRLFVAAAEQFVTADRWRRRVRARRGLCPTQSVRNHRSEHCAHAGLVRAGSCVVCMFVCVLPETVVGYFISSKVSRFFFFQTCLSTNTKRIKVDPKQYW